MYQVRLILAFGFVHMHLYGKDINNYDKNFLNSTERKIFINHKVGLAFLKLIVLFPINTLWL